jgi:hypothetical protein
LCKVLWMNYRAVNSRLQLNSDFKVQTSDFIPVYTYAGGTVTLLLLEILEHLQRCSVCDQYVTPDSKIYCEKAKMCQFSSGNWFSCTKFVPLSVAGERRNTVVQLQKRV